MVDVLDKSHGENQNKSFIFNTFLQFMR